MIRINPTKMLVGGDQRAAKNFLGPARSQLEILKNQMSFQNLSQGVRKIWLNEDVYVECRKIFDYQECRVWVRPVVVEEQTVRYFLIVFATGSGNEAVVWDIIKDEVFIEKQPLSDIEDKLGQEMIPAPIEAVCPETNTYIWDSSRPTHALGNELPDDPYSPLMFPNYNIGWYEIDIDDLIGEESGSGDSILCWAHNFVYPSELSDYYLDFWPEQTKWEEIPYVDSSPLPYPNKTVVSEVWEGGDEIDAKASFISTYMVLVDDSMFEPPNPDEHVIFSKFEELTGEPWPDDKTVWRYYQFWHPFFCGYTKDMPVNIENLRTKGYGLQIADTWENGVWITDYYTGLELVRMSLTWNNSGIASITKTTEGLPLNNPQVLLFEYVSVCHEFIDTYGTGMCDEEESELVQYFRIYEHGRITNSGYRKKIFDATNGYRETNGLHDLVFNSALCDSAQTHAEDMAGLYAEEGNMGVDGHMGTDGSTSSERMFYAGYFIGIEDDVENVINETVDWGYLVTENVAAVFDSSWEIGGDEPILAAMDAWKASPGHNANMLDENLSELGVGHATCIYNNVLIHIFVQNYGHIDHRYPGFSPFDVTNLKSYIDEKFIFDPVNETSRLPKMYLIGSVELNKNEFYRLTGRTQE